MGGHSNPKNVVCYASSPWNPAADVTISNLLIDSHPNYDYVSTEDFGGENMMIGWIEYASCVEGNNPPVFNEAVSRMHSSAITVKILPSTDVPGHSETSAYAVTAKLCSNPVYAFNSGYAMSWVVDQTTDPPLITGLADTDNWIGDNAATLMGMHCSEWGVDDEPPTLDSQIYGAACNGAGIHIQSLMDIGNCYFDETPVGHDITVWMGFDAVDQRACSLESDGSYSLESKPDSDEETTAAPGTTMPPAWYSAYEQEQDVQPQKVGVSAPMAGAASADPNAGDHGSDGFESMAMGAAVGAMVIVLIAVFVVLLVNRRMRKAVDTSNAAAVETPAQHVPDTSVVSEDGASSI